MSQGYNGWTNRATWLVNVWCNPESREDVEAIRYSLEEQYDAMPDGPLKDMVELSEVDWDQLLEHFEEEAEDEENLEVDLDGGLSHINE